MKNPNRVEKFIQDTFNLYLLDYQEFFQFMDSKTGEICKMPLVINGKLEMSLVYRAATILGVSVDSLTEMDEVETWKWWNKYDYFDLREAFDRVEAFSYIHEHDDVQRLDVAIWGGASAEIKPTRYDEADVFHRLIEELKEYDKFLPGSYHKDANIKGRMYVVNFFTMRILIAWFVLTWQWLTELRPSFSRRGVVNCVSRKSTNTTFSFPC